MRVRFLFRLAGPAVLPWGYVEGLRGMVYRALERADVGLAGWLHDEGVKVGARRYKPVVYSWLWPRRAWRVGDVGLGVEGPVRWWLGSPLREVVEGVVGVLLGEGRVRLGEVEMEVEGVEVEADPDFGAGVLVVQTLSPLVVSGVGEAWRRVYLAPGEGNYSRVLTGNLRRKAEALGWEVREGAEVRVEPVGEVRSRLVWVRGTGVRGFEGRLRIEGDPTLLRLGYHMGFGERNAQGFGMVKICEGTGDVRDPGV